MVVINEPGRPEVILCPMPGAHSAVVAAFVGAGSAHETRENNGISHLIEHVVLAGSRRYPSRQKFQAAIDETGGYLDALTHKEYTEFAFQCFPDGVERALELLAEALVRPTFSAEAVASEREIVLEEMLTGTFEGPNDPFTQLLWGSDSLGLPIIGRRDALEAFTPETLRDFHSRTYHAANTVIVVAGPLDEAQVRRGLKAFDEMPGGLARPVASDGGARLPAERGLSVDRFRSEAGEACLMFRTPGWRDADPRRHTLLQLVTQVFQTRVYQSLVGPALPVYYLYTGQEVFVPNGFVYFYFNVGRERFRATLMRVLEALDALRVGRMPAPELEVNKRRYELTILSQLDDPRAVAERMGSDRLLCGPEHALSVAEELEQVRSVTGSEFDQVAQTTLDPEVLHAVVRGGVSWLETRKVRRQLEIWSGSRLSTRRARGEGR